MKDRLQPIILSATVASTPLCGSDHAQSVISRHSNDDDKSGNAFFSLTALYFVNLNVVCGRE